MSDSESRAIERRIERFAVGVGAAMTLGAGLGWGISAAEGAAAGAALCWLNLRWLRAGAEALIRLGLAQAGVEAVQVPKRIHAKFFGRIVLLLVVVYVIVVKIKLPAVAFLCGLLAVVPAIVLELGYEIVHGHHRWNAQ